jgi:predicted ATPase/DNA-binding winged helix-turn-helix (wHTH) protein
MAGPVDRRVSETILYEIGPFRLDPTKGVLMRLDTAEPLGRRAVDVLATLVRNARKPMTKDAIIDEAWARRVVEEQNLSVQISSIRRVLSQAPGGERWIETLSGRGYRFVGPVVAVRDGVRYDAAATRSGNLPTSLSSFVGRERELVELKRLLARNRIVTMVGMAGVGKTRLAVQAVSEVSDAYADGSWFVDLAPLADGDLVTSAAARALNMQPSPGKPLVDALCRHLKGRRALLVVDNCEHVLDAVAAMVEGILRGAPELTIVSTSREPLRVEGEQVYDVPPLRLPDPTSDREAIGRSDAVVLFVDRAQHQRTDFALTETSAPAVAKLCARLDGIPLALELAAALVLKHSIEEIDRQLDDRFNALTQGRRVALPRQQTLRATLDWSYDLLTAEERVALRRLSVFAGTFSVEAASAVISDASIDRYSVTELVSRLAARSLVIVDTASASRYRLLETTRAYALQQLDEAGEAATMRRRHAGYFRDRFDAGESDWLRVSDDEWSTRYAVDLDNARVALDWALGDEGDASIGVALAGASGRLWTKLSMYGEGLQRLNGAAARLGDGIVAPDEARLWLWLGTLARHVNPATSRAAYQRAVDLYEHCNRPFELGLSNVRLAHVLVSMGRFDDAAAALAKARPLLERHRVPKLLAFHFGAAAYLKLMTSDAAGALSDFERASELFREAGDEFSVLLTVRHIGEIKWTLGDLRGAEAALREYIATSSRHLVKRMWLANAWGLLAGVLTEGGDVGEALEAVRESVRLFQQDAGNAWAVMDHFAMRAARAGKLENAARIAGYADACHAEREAIRDPNDARAPASLHALLREKLPAGKRETLLAEGAALSEDDACRLAIEE